MFHNLDLTTVPFLIKLAILFLGILLGSGFGIIMFRSRRHRAKKELIPATANDTMIVSAERLFKHMSHNE
jgi:hypothetical protein